MKRNPPRYDTPFRIDEGHTYIGRDMVHCRAMRDAESHGYNGEGDVTCRLCGAVLPVRHVRAQNPTVSPMLRAAVYARKGMRTGKALRRAFGDLRRQAGLIRSAWTGRGRVPVFSQNPRGPFMGLGSVKMLGFLQRRAGPGWVSIGNAEKRNAEILEARGYIEIARHPAPATWQVRLTVPARLRLPPLARRNPASVRWTKYNTDIETWFERDRAYVGLRDKQGRTIADWWDEEVQSDVDAGYLSPKDWHGSAVETANERGYKAKRERRRNPLSAGTKNLAQKHYQELLGQGVPPARAEKMVRSLLTVMGEAEGVPYFAGNPHGRAVRRSGNSPVQIYGRTEKIFMQKTDGPYRGQKFVHSFRPGVRQIGLPARTVIQTPDGGTTAIPKRAVLLQGKSDLWRNFQA